MATIDIERVSIVVPCFNRAALVGQAIESALAHGEGAEIIVVDDGSTDASWERIRSFRDGIRSFRIPNGGVSAARNFGVKQATGVFIKFLDSDDLLPSGAIATLNKAQRTLPPRGIAFGDACSIGPAGNAIDPFGYGYGDIAPPGPLSRKVLLSGTMSPYLPLYPVEALRRVGGFNPAYSLGEDQELAVRLILAGYQFHRIPVSVAEVREHPGDRLSRTGPTSIYDRHAALFSDIVQLLKSATPSLDCEEKHALAQTIWIVARDAARGRHRTQALRLFGIAAGLVGPFAAAPPPLRPLYRWVNPYIVEQILELVKTFKNYLRRGRYSA